MDGKVGAFPFNPGNGAKPDFGLDIRDYIAIKAMQAMLTGVQPFSVYGGYDGEIAKSAYIIADSMIAKSNEEG